MNVTSARVLKHLEQRSEVGYTYPKTTYSSIMPLLRELDSRQVTGNAAMDRVGSFLQQIEAGEDEVKAPEKIKISLKEVVMRCLDRNLKAGINDKTIQAVFSKKGKEAAVQQGEELLQASKAKEEDRDYSNSKWGVALGKPCNLNHLKHLLSTVTAEEGLKTWYMSRKLDGVRCIVKVTFDVIDGIKTPLDIVSMETLSRRGKLFHSLDVLKEELSSLLGRCPAVVKLLERTKLPSKQNTTSLFLDGEVCALLTEKGSEDGFTEDFAGIVGAIRRQSSTIPKPAYFPFDILTEAEFLGWEDDTYHYERDPFYIRVKRVQGLIEYCQGQGSVVVRRLVQTPITTFRQVEQATEEAAKKGWEGLIFRKGDKYVGKRTSSISKYKQWQEAEYTVLDVQKAMMRLPVDQQYEEREGLASEWAGLVPLQTRTAPFPSIFVLIVPLCPFVGRRLHQS
jgi:DNA ligase-1